MDVDVMGLLAAAGRGEEHGGVGGATGAEQGGQPVGGVGVGGGIGGDQVGYAQSSLDEATPTRDTLAAQVTGQKAARQTAITAGDVELVGRINVQLGSSTALYDTMDSSVASAHARVVRTRAAKKAAC